VIEDLSTTLPLSVLVNQRHQKPDSSRPPASGNGLWAGPFRGVRRGQGTDFDDLRHYTAGDEVRHVDWKVSARRNALHTRLYREEKEHLSTFVCDLRSAMFTGSKTLTSVTTGHLIASLIWHAIDSGGRVSLMLITDSDIKSTRSASGHKSAIAACGLLASTFAKVRRDCLSSSYANQSELNELNDNQLSRTIDELLSLGRRAGTLCRGG